MTGLQPSVYPSSPGNARGFCPRCGSPLFYRSSRHPGECHFYAALLDAPDQVVPQMHVHRDEALSWLHLDDDLPDG
jgi:hypothetical protein